MSLQWLQASANLDHFKRLCAERTNLIEVATEKFNDGEAWHMEASVIVSHYRYITAQRIFQVVKDDAMMKLDLSKLRVSEADPDIRAKFNQMEAVRWDSPAVIT